MENLIIRNAVTDDAKYVSEIIKEAMKQYTADSNIPGTLNSLTETVSDIEKYISNDVVLVAKYHNRISGTVRISKTGNSAYQISRFSVSTAMQKLGVGSILFSAAEDYLKSIKAKECILYTALTNLTMVRFYSSRGFVLEETKYERGYPRGKFVKKY